MHIRTVQAIIAMIGLALASFTVFANQGSGDCWHDHDSNAHFEKHMSMLHDSLKLSTDQETAWNEFSSKMKPVRMERPDRKDWKHMSAPDRLDKALDLLKSREKALADRAAAVHTFYAALTPDQQKIFDQRFEAYHHERRHGHWEHKSKPDTPMPGEPMPNKSM